MEVRIDAINGDRATCLTEGGARVISEVSRGCKVGDGVSLSIRPEKITLGPTNHGDQQLAGVIERLIYLGTDTHYQIRVDAGPTFLVRVQNAHASAAFEAGQSVGLMFDPDAARMLID